MEEKCIVINQNFNSNLYECIKCIAHEYRHYYQWIVINSDYNHHFYYKWKQQFENYNYKSYSEYITSPIEVDAIAYTRLFFNRYFDFYIDYKCSTYSNILDVYILKYL